ncbi:hypothetical protein C8J56DRAFT_1157385 [Mycena floridula]|nr:hypothetical protein C8J56DRAFT_1157385 [Mycena floridula]
MASDAVSTNGARFMRIYASLPPEAQRTLVEKHLSPLLDNVAPADRARKVMNSATKLQQSCSTIPKLNLHTKRRELEDLLDLYDRDSKCGFTKERSNGPEILHELLTSLASWTAEIWSVVYEHNMHFEKAHACLLFATSILIKINDGALHMHTECKCDALYCPIKLLIRDKSGKIVKQFNFNGPRTMDRLLLWVWRELLVSISTSGGTLARKTYIPDMLMDIENILGWEALERMVYGGKYAIRDDAQSDTDDEWEDFNEKDVEEEEEEEEEDDEECVDGGKTSDKTNKNLVNSHCPCNLHGGHWTDKHNRHRNHLNDLVYKRLAHIFKHAPSLSLFQSAVQVCLSKPDARTELTTAMIELAPISSETMAASLEIFASLDNAAMIVELLNEHSYLLRPRDFRSFQSAVAVLARHPEYVKQALQIIEKEMISTIHAIRAAMLSSFSLSEEQRHKDELAKILKLTLGSNSRNVRIDRWVETVSTPTSSPLHPVAFAAMVMGFPTAEMEDGEDAELISILAMNPNDPHLEDLRDEFRPKLKERFEGWLHCAHSIKSGYSVLIKCYLKMVEIMPYLRAADVTSEMLSKLNDRPGKHFLCDALENLGAFAKGQRKKLALHANKKKREEKKGYCDHHHPQAHPAALPPQISFRLERSPASRPCGFRRHRRR